MKISIVICTRNRSSMMARAVQSVILQTASPGDYEIVIVDNGSTDETEAQAKSLIARSKGRSIRYVKEARAGIAFARNTGYEAAQGEYVAYIDDDAAASPDWIDTLLRLIRESKPEPIGLGGVILPLYEVSKPKWFLDSYEERRWGSEQRCLTKGESFSASNMAVRRDALVAVNGFPTDVGMSGNRLFVGEEPMLFQRLWEQMDCEGRILYSPELHVRHSVPEAKMRLTAMGRRRFVAGQFAAMMIRSRGERRFAAGLRALLALLGKSVFAVVRIVKVRNVHRWVFEGLGIVAEPLGRLLALLGIEPKMRRV